MMRINAFRLFAI